MIDYCAMNDEELRAYVLAHHQDTVAFHTYVDGCNNAHTLPLLNRKNGVRSGCNRSLTRSCSALKTKTTSDRAFNSYLAPSLKS